MKKSSRKMPSKNKLCKILSPEVVLTITHGAEELEVPSEEQREEAIVEDTMRIIQGEITKIMCSNNGTREVSPTTIGNTSTCGSAGRLTPALYTGRLRL